jgi:tripartite-type tricarboxylate transporter receptor subunit TctC
MKALDTGAMRSSLAMSRRQFGLTAGAAALMSPQLLTAAHADTYPSRAITLIAPAAAGGPTDIIGRASAKALQEAFKQTVLVENKGGAAGNIGAQTAAKAEPDGYTLLVVLAPLAQNIAIYREPGFSLEKDFVPIAHMASVDLVIAAGKNLPINNFDEFLAYTKANPGKISCGSQSPPQMQYLMKTTGINMTVAPYKGSALITNDLIGGQVDVGLVPYSDIAQHVAAGTAKVLFTNGPKRVRQLPDVQAVCERFPGFYFWSWYGVAAPARTPALVVERLRKELTTLAKSPDFVAFVTKLGLAPVDEPEKLGEVISKEIAQWQQLVVELQLPRI